MLPYLKHGVKHFPDERHLPSNEVFRKPFWVLMEPINRPFVAALAFSFNHFGSGFNRKVPKCPKCPRCPLSSNLVPQPWWEGWSNFKNLILIRHVNGYLNGYVCESVCLSVTLFICMGKPYLCFWAIYFCCQRLSVGLFSQLINFLTLKYFEFFWVV